MTAATQALAATAWTGANAVPNLGVGGALHVHTFDALTVATTAIDEINDIFEIGYLPPGIKVHGFIVTATDMDSGTPALAYKLRVNGVDLVTGITVGQSASSDVFWCTPTETAAIELVDAKVTTAAATAVQGTFTLRVLYTAA